LIRSILFAILMMPCISWSAEAAPPPEEGVRFLIEIPVWIPGYSGQFAYGDVDVDGSGDDDGFGHDWFGQLFDADAGLEFFFLGRVRVDVNAWSFLADTFGGKLSETVTFRQSDGTIIDASLRPAMVRLIAARRIKQWAPGSSGNYFIRLRGYGGVRYHDVDFEATLTRYEYPLEKHVNWLDPIVGVQTTFFVHEHRRFSAWTDIGGFGAGSNIAWWWELDAGYKFTDWFLLRLGWTMMYIDHSGTAVKWNAWLSGPSLALAFFF
jgi:hypothetical protein